MEEKAAKIAKEKKQAEINGVPYVPSEPLKHWIGAELPSESLVQCVQIAQPDQKAVDEVEVYGCDIDDVFQLGLGQILRFPDRVCKAMKPVTVPFTSKTKALAIRKTCDAKAAAAEGDNDENALFDSLASSVVVKLNAFFSGAVEVLSADEDCGNPTDPGYGGWEPSRKEVDLSLEEDLEKGKKKLDNAAYNWFYFLHLWEDLWFFSETKLTSSSSRRAFAPLLF